MSTNEAPLTLSLSKGYMFLEFFIALLGGGILGWVHAIFFTRRVKNKIATPASGGMVRFLLLFLMQYLFLLGTLLVFYLVWHLNLVACLGAFLSTFLFKVYKDAEVKI
jgi:hypothetical protein